MLQANSALEILVKMCTLLAAVERGEHLGPVRGPDGGGVGGLAVHLGIDRSGRAAGVVAREIVHNSRN